MSLQQLDEKEKTNLCRQQGQIGKRCRYADMDRKILMETKQISVQTCKFAQRLRKDGKGTKGGRSWRHEGLAKDNKYGVCMNTG